MMHFWVGEPPPPPPLPLAPPFPLYVVPLVCLLSIFLLTPRSAYRNPGCLVVACCAANEYLHSPLSLAMFMAAAVICSAAFVGRTPNRIYQPSYGTSFMGCLALMISVMGTTLDGRLPLLLLVILMAVYGLQAQPYYLLLNSALEEFAEDDSRYQVAARLRRLAILRLWLGPMGALGLPLLMFVRFRHETTRACAYSLVSVLSVLVEEVSQSERLLYTKAMEDGDIEDDPGTLLLL